MHNNRAHIDSVQRSFETVEASSSPPCIVTYGSLLSLQHDMITCTEQHGSQDVCTTKQACIQRPRAPQQGNHRGCRWLPPCIVSPESHVPPQSPSSLYHWAEHFSRGKRNKVKHAQSTRVPKHGHHASCLSLLPCISNSRFYFTPYVRRAQVDKPARRQDLTPCALCIHKLAISCSMYPR